MSFEFSPPKTEEAEASLWSAIKRLEPLQPAFVSVTYGAGGSTRERTHATVKRIVEETSLKPAAHLTCVGASKRRDRRDRASLLGRRHPPYRGAARRHARHGRGHTRPHPDGYRSTPELIEGIRRIAPFEISVSFYPERHPDSPNHGHDIRIAEGQGGCGRQPRAGPVLLSTMTPPRASATMRPRPAIAIPVIPGIMPTTAFRGVERMAAQMRRVDSRLADARL